MSPDEVGRATVVILSRVKDLRGLSVDELVARYESAASRHGQATHGADASGPRDGLRASRRRTCMTALAESEDSGLGFGAKMTLGEWRKGRLRFP
jgi:hypothetical protein